MMASLSTYFLNKLRLIISLTTDFKHGCLEIYLLHSHLVLFALGFYFFSGLMLFLFFTDFHCTPSLVSFLVRRSLFQVQFLTSFLIPGWFWFLVSISFSNNNYYCLINNTFNGKVFVVVGQFFYSVVWAHQIASQ